MSAHPTPPHDARSGHGHDHGEHHDHSLRPYVLVLLALMVLTVVTVLAANVPMPDPWDDLAALAIAMVKATLVVTFFMHVRGSTSMIKIAAAGGFFWLLLFFVLTLNDYWTRLFTFDLL